jgi:hypothetical protein
MAADLAHQAPQEGARLGASRTPDRAQHGGDGTILERLDEILTFVRLGVPKDLRRSLACTTIIETIMGSVRRVCRNVKRWCDASMALRWTAAAMLQAAKGFRRLKAKSQVPQLRTALSAHPQKSDSTFSVAQTQQAASCPPTPRRSRFSTSSGTFPRFRNRRCRPPTRRPCCPHR